MKTKFPWLSLCSGLQALVLGGAVVVATIHIETILLSGPLYGLLGVASAVVGWKLSRSVSAVVFGLSAPAMGLFLFALIFLQSWSPADARVPVPIILFGYELAVLPFALRAFHRGLACAGNEGLPLRWQVSLRSLLLITAYAAVALGGGRIVRDCGGSILQAIAAGAWIAMALALVETARIALQRLRVIESRPA